MSSELDLLVFVQRAVEDEAFRKLLREGDYEAAFKHAGLSGPSPEQRRALENLSRDWQPLKDLAKSFGKTDLPPTN